MNFVVLLTLLSSPHIRCLSSSSLRPITKIMDIKSTPSKWAAIPQAPADKILGLNEEFLKDEATGKISLGVGAYRDDNGKPYVLKAVREARKCLEEKNLDHEYTGIAGIPAFLKQTLIFAYGADAEVIKSGRVAAVQSLSGTGACRLVGEFISKFMGAGTTIHIPNPTWGNHLAIMKNAGLEVARYSYFDAATRGFDYTGMMADVKAAKDGSCFLLHACAHNPTGRFKLLVFLPLHPETLSSKHSERCPLLIP
jgi:aspartate aminotransferase, mitochondrial